MAASDVEVEALWTKIRSLRAELVSVRNQWAVDVERRKLAEHGHPKPAVQVAWEAYADIEQQMIRLKAEPPQGTLAWRRWVSRGLQEDWRDIFSYCHDMAREGRAGRVEGLPAQAERGQGRA